MQIAPLAGSPAGVSLRLRRLAPGGGSGRRAGGSEPSVGRVAPREVAVPVILDLLDAACAAGSSVPGALDAVGYAVGGVRGRVLVDAAASLTLGARWPEAWTRTAAALAAGRGPDGTRSAPADLGPVADALRAGWEDGVPPGAALRAAAGTLRRERHASALEAAARLGVRLVLPLGLCYLPAFVLVGLVPVIVSMAAGVLGR
jgi:hypothetical protein